MERVTAMEKARKEIEANINNIIDIKVLMLLAEISKRLADDKGGSQYGAD